jgi:hypothetical protein
MRTFRKFIRAFAALVYCVLALCGCVLLLGLMMGLFSGTTVPFLGALAHNGLPVLPQKHLLLAANAAVLVVACDVWFRVTKKYQSDDEHPEP